MKHLNKNKTPEQELLDKIKSTLDSTYSKKKEVMISKLDSLLLIVDSFIDKRKYSMLNVGSLYKGEGNSKEIDKLIQSIANEISRWRQLYLTVRDTIHDLKNGTLLDSVGSINSIMREYSFLLEIYNDNHREYSYIKRSYPEEYKPISKLITTFLCVSFSIVFGFIIFTDYDMLVYLYILVGLTITYIVFDYNVYYGNILSGGTRN